MFRTAKGAKARAHQLTMPNRLASETSPYLLQHADNPVDWYPWGPEALERARQEDKPILLSIGYAACHWCHVMAHESFEDAETARLMNAAFVNIKVDREERPDIDGIYMQAVQAMTGHGGWPMTVFLTPDGVPFYGGTYFPPEDRHGIPSFRKILFTISAAYTDQRDRVAETASAMRRLYAESAARRDPGIAVEARTLELAYRSLSRQYDVAHGGFGGAPKFPPTMALEFLLRYWRRTKNDDALNMAHHTFLQMGRGGIFDQIGGGFARYSVDGRWQVPHFEKMLYDNALLIRLGAHLYLATRDAEVRRVTEQTIEWAARELRSPEGAFYSSFDADSEGEEGLFYTWDSDEFDAVSGASAPILREYFGVTAEGNFEGRNILHRPSGDEVAAVRAGIPPAELATLIQSASLRLREARATRVWPGRDDKIIAAWNGLMARALADASLAFDSDEYAAMSLQCCTFLFDKLTETPDGELPRVLRSYGRGGAYIPGFLEDHAALGLAAIAAYGLTFNSIWLRRARNVADSCVRFFRGDDGLFRDTANDAEVLITRPRDTSDNATPAGNSLAAELLLLVADYYDREPEREIATAAVSSLSHAVSSYPSAFGHLLCAADTLVNGTLQLALVGSDLPAALERNGMKAVLAGRYIPALVVAASAPGSDDLPLLRGKTAGTAAVTAFLCRRYLCDAPTSSAGELQTQIESALRSGNAPEESSS